MDLTGKNVLTVNSDSSVSASVLEMLRVLATVGFPLDLTTVTVVHLLKIPILLGILGDLPPKGSPQAPSQPKALLSTSKAMLGGPEALESADLWDGLMEWETCKEPRAPLRRQQLAWQTCNPERGPGAGWAWGREDSWARRTADCTH